MVKAQPMGNCNPFFADIDLLQQHNFTIELSDQSGCFKSIFGELFVDQTFFPLAPPKSVLLPFKFALFCTMLRVAFEA